MAMLRARSGRSSVKRTEINRRLRLAALGAAPLVSLLADPQLVSAATTLFWSANGTTQGGAGAWTTTGSNWGTAAGGPFTTVWVNANIDSARFGGTAGNVTFTGPFVANQIITDLSGYNIGSGNSAAASNTLTFSGANSGVNTNYAGGTTTLSAHFRGTLTKTGAGRLELGNGSNPNTVRYVLNAGALTSASMARISSSSPGSLVPAFFTFNGGGWGINTGNQDTGANRGVTIGAGGAFFGSTSLTVATTISSPIVGTAGGNITLTGAGPFTGNTHTAGSILILNNTANSFDGDINVALGTLRLGLSGVVPDTAAVNLTGGNFDLNTFNETISTLMVNSASSDVTNGGVLTASAYDLRASASIDVTFAGAGAVATKTTGGVVTLTAANTFNGGFVLSAGTIRAGATNALGAANSPFTINGGVLAPNSGTARSLTYNYTFGGDITLGDGTGTGALTLAGTMNLGGATRTITLANAADTISAVISNGGLNVTAATGTLDITGANTYTGGFTLTSGNVRAGNNNALGATGSAVNLTSGTLSGNNATARTLDYAHTFSGDITLGQASGGTGALTLAGTVDLVGATRTVTVVNPIDTISAVINNGGLTKAGGGILVLSGANTYSANTTVTAGTLRANNTSGSGTGGGTVTVNTGGKLAGTGSVVGAITVAGGGTLNPGQLLGTGGTEDLDVASATVQNGGIIAVTLGAPGSPLGTSDQLNVSDVNGLTFDAGSLIHPVTTNATGNGTYRLINHNGFVGSLPAGLPSGFDTYSLVDTGTAIDLSIVVMERTWVDDTAAGNWSVGANWTSPTQPDGIGAIAHFANTTPNNTARTVTIDDADKTLGVVDLSSSSKYTIAASGANKLVIDTWGADGLISVSGTSHEITAPVQLNDRTIVNTSSGNALTMSGVVSGTAGIIKSGPDTLVLTGTNTYTGATAIDGGTLSISSDANLGTAPGVLTPDSLTFAGGTLKTTSAVTIATNRQITLNSGGGTFETDADTVFAGVVSGTGGLTKTGTAVLDLTGANTFTGGVALNNGTIRINATTGLGAANSAVAIANGTTLAAANDTARTLTYAYAVNGDFTIGQSTGGTGALNLAGTVTLGGATRNITLGNSAAKTHTISAIISNGALNLTGGVNTLALTGVNTYAGDTTITSGTLSLNGTSTLGDGTGTLNFSGGTLATTASRSVTTAPVPNPLNFSNNPTIVTTSTAAAVDLNFTTSTIAGGAGITFRNDGADGAADTFEPRFSGDFNIGNQITINNGATGLTRVSSFNLSSGSGQTFSGQILGNGSFRRSASTAGTGGTTILSGQNIYTGGTALTDGLIGFGIDSLIIDDIFIYSPIGEGALTISGVASNVAGFFAEGGARSVHNPIVITHAGTINIPGSNNLAMTGTVNLGTAARTFNVTNTGGTTFSGVMSGALGGITKTGAEYLALTGTNTYTGVTSVNGGELRVSTSANIGDGSATNNIAFDNGGILKVNGGITSPNRTVTVNAGGGTWDASAASVIKNVAGTGTLTKLGASILETTNVRTGGLVVSGGSVIVTAGGSAGSGTSVLGTISTSGGQFDITDNKLVVTTAGSVGAWNGTAYSGVTGQVASGYTNGTWSGNGIMTATSPTFTTSLGIAVAGDVGRTTFGGQTVAATDTLVMFTYNGDANLSGNVDADDYFQIDSHYNKGTNIPANDAIKSWHNGDFNYDGEIDGDDFALIDMGFSGQGSPIAPGDIASGGVTAVPEPTALFVLPMLSAGLLGRRRRTK